MSQLPPEVHQLIDAALTEDQVFSDPTTMSLVPPEIMGVGMIRAKARGILAGAEVALAVFQRVDPGLDTEALLSDGAELFPGADIARVVGSAGSILRAERIALNFLQRMSGIASDTNTYVRAVAGCGARIVDTRKTAPGHRYLDKYAVRMGGGFACAAAGISVTRPGTAKSMPTRTEIEAVLSNGGDGVGLYRTEYLYLTSKTQPTEEEHFEAYKKCIELLAGRPLTIRTADLGADKYTQAQAEEPERNPFLGLRSIRYCLQNLPMFKTQLRAILRASALGPVKVMFPLVSTAMELKQAKLILNDTMEECEEDGIEFDADMPVGVMIEVPSAALTATTLAREVSFFSIGTNDLIQYTLAVDRANERVANLYTGAHPAVLQLIKMVIRAGRRFDVDTSLCGEIAGDVEYTMLLIGMGLRTLSLVPSQLPNVKRVIRSVDIGTCERLARKVGSFDSERQVMNCLREKVQEILPGLDGGRTAG